MSIGLDTQIGYAIENPAGTFTTVTRFFGVVPPLGLREVPTYQPSRAIFAGRRIATPSALGPSRVEGPVTHELTAESTGLLLRAMLEGTPATTGAGPYTHTYDLSTEISSVSAQVGLPSTAAVHPVAYAGLRCREWTITVSPGDVFAYLTLDWIGGALADYDGTPSLATASFGTLTPLLFSHATLEVASGEIEVDNITLTGTTGWEMEHKISSTSPRAPRTFRANRHVIGGSFVNDFSGTTQLGRHLAGTTASVEVVFAASTSKSLTFTMTCEFPGEMPTVQNEGKTKETVAFNAVHASSDASAFTAELINSDATP